MRDHLHEYIYDSTDPKANEGLGTDMGALIVLVSFLAVLQVALDTVSAWHRDTMVWLNETASYLAGFWPF
ncbi:hypothetical protein [Sinorhizobium medicae]|uniref:hypothetical protein n=1 Tax=Sinorhizobium medicae TaxID=110321 RepID=UPI0012976718|nr:hypothetical protein [Sinorhizobium medicae]MQX78898.1 hypothetical protein [Sinorhizobium medicae]